MGQRRDARGSHQQSPIPVRLIPHIGPRNNWPTTRPPRGESESCGVAGSNGVARVTDRPASERISGPDRAHVVATTLTSRREMDAAVSAWLRDAKQLGVVPAEAIPYDHFLARLRDQA
jgi:hypothetical protein